MTVLRSREIVSTIKPQSHFETLETGGIEPVTPAKTLEPSKHALHTTPSSIDSIPSPDTVGLGFGSVPETRRRSLRLVLRKRKSENEDGLERVGGDRVGVVETGVSDSRVRKIRVLDRIRVKNGVLGKLGLGMEEEEEVGSGERELDLCECVSPSNLRSSLDVSRRETSDGSVEKGKRKLSNGVDLLSSEFVMENLSGEGFLKLRSGKKITKRRMEENSGLVGFMGFESNGGDNSVRVCGGRDEEKINEQVLNGGIGKGVVMNESESDLVVDEISGSLMMKGVDKVEKIELDLDCKVDISAGNAILDALRLSGKVGLKELDKGQIRVKTCTGVYARRRLSRDEKGKGKVVEDLLLSNGNAVLDTAHLPENVSLKELEKEQMTDLTRGVKAGRRLTRKEKGKSKVGDDDFLLSGIDVAEWRLESKVENSPKKAVSKTLVLEDDVLVQAEKKVVGVDNKENVNRERGYKDRFRDIARQNASRFAHFSSQEVEENSVNDVAESEMPRREADREMEEDWPGPFSTAMRIIKDREMNVNVSQQISCLEKGKATSLTWVPKKDQHCDCSKQSIPQLKDLCMAILAKNADAITSLVSVPDVLRHKLSQLLCDSRRMNSHFLDLLVRGSPMEIRIRDCSWLTEEQFTRSFQECEASNLMVLQLDQCGRCMPDYVLSTTLACLPNSLPSLTTLSLKGACRLSDVGLNTLVASAPALRSINLSQCSLLTSDGINSLADSLGSVLRELYLDDCQTIDAMLILPALLKLEHLEVLSLAGIQTVCDAFVSKLVAVLGSYIKELVLADCTKLTDSSLKVIAETCTGLCALDLCNLCKLTDSTMGYLANGCRAIQTLKLCRNSFSDEAVAAYLEASGESLKELSLNNVNKVGHNTAISIARCSRNLFSLDISWCRNLTNEALGLIVDSCLSLKVLKLFGCTQITNIFLDGHSNPQVQIIGFKMTPILKHLKEPDPLEGPLHYSSVSS